MKNTRLFHLKIALHIKNVLFYSEDSGAILSELVNFASSVPDFRRLNKGTYAIHLNLNSATL